MGVMVVVAHVLPICAVLLSFTLLVPIEACADATIEVNPSFGPVGQTVKWTGTSIRRWPIREDG